MKVGQLRREIYTEIELSGKYYDGKLEKVETSISDTIWNCIPYLRYKVVHVWKERVLIWGPMLHVNFKKPHRHICVSVAYPPPPIHTHTRFRHAIFMKSPCRMLHVTIIFQLECRTSHRPMSPSQNKKNRPCHCANCRSLHP